MPLNIRNLFSSYRQSLTPGEYTDGKTPPDISIKSFIEIFLSLISYIAGLLIPPDIPEVLSIEFTSIESPSFITASIGFPVINNSYRSTVIMRILSLLKRLIDIFLREPFFSTPPAFF